MSNDAFPVVKFDNTDPAADKNLRTVRPHHQSPIDNTKAGVVNLGSKTTGASTGATGNYATIGGGDQNTASGNGATVPGGTNNTANGTNSYAEGSNTFSNGNASHSEGLETSATATAAHAEGNETTASGIASHAEGVSVVASGTGAHAEGNGTTASGNNSHAEGEGSVANGEAGHAEGFSSSASRFGQHAESAFSNGRAGDYQYGSLTLGAVALAQGVDTELLDANGNEFTLDDSKTYAIRVRLVVASPISGSVAHIVHDALVKTTVGGISIVGNNLTLNQNPAGHTFVLIVSTSPTALILQFTNATVGNVNVAATIDWTEAPNA